MVTDSSGSGRNLYWFISLVSTIAPDFVKCCLYPVGNFNTKNPGLEFYGFPKFIYCKLQMVQFFEFFYFKEQIFMRSKSEALKDIK